MIESLTFLGRVLNCLNPYKENSLRSCRQTTVDRGRLHAPRWKPGGNCLWSYMVDMIGPQRVVNSQTEITLFYVQVTRFEVKFLLI